MAASFADLMIDAQRSPTALDNLSKRDGTKRAAGAVAHGKQVCDLLLEHQRTAMMTRGEANALQSALDSARATAVLRGGVRQPKRLSSLGKGDFHFKALRAGSGAIPPVEILARWTRAAPGNERLTVAPQLPENEAEVQLHEW